MNLFNPLPQITAFPPTVTTLPPVVTNLPPIVTRQTNIIHRPFIINQPHINEVVTQVQNHIIKRHHCCTRPMCCECCDFVEEGCCQPMPPCGQLPNPCSQFLGQQSPVGRPPLTGAMNPTMDDINGPQFY